MNISPHHQRPTKYPWPGMASTAAVILAIVVIAIIGFILVVDPFGGGAGDADPSATRAGITRLF